SKNASKEIPNELKESPDAPLVKNRVSNNKDCTAESSIVVEKKIVVPTVVKIEFVKAKQQEKPVRKPVKYAEMYMSQATKDETLAILKKFITEIENLVDKKVKVIRSDNETEFKNSVLNDFCVMKGIKREFSVARTPQQNGVTEKRNRTLIEAARTMVLVVTPYNKTPYELFRGRSPALSFIKPFGCHVTIINTLDHLGKSDGKADEGYFVGYSMHNKAFRDGSLFDSSSKNPTIDEPQSSCDAENKDDNGVNKDSRIDAHEKSANSITDVNTIWPSINTTCTDFDTGSLNINTISPTVSTASPEATHVDFLGDQPEGDMSIINTTYQVTSTPNTRIHKDHSLDLVIGDVQSGVMTRKMTKTTHEQGFISTVYEEKTREDLNTCLFACFLSKIEPTRVAKSLSDPAWVEAMQEEWYLSNYTYFKPQNTD
nr:putative ribonuclease H-like domain-containing protein [Tanacetum cinerariifolium]